MGSLVLELQRDAVNSHTKVTDLLRKALVVARKLSIPDFEAWIASELSGYRSDQKAPDYRRVHGEVVAFNPFNGWLPVIVSDSSLHKMLSERHIGHPIGELESLLEDGNGSLHMRIPHEVEQLLMSCMDVPLRPVFHLGKNQLHQVLQAVRNNVLEWALKLEQDGVLGEGMTFTEEEKNRARKTTHVFVNNFQGVLGDVQNSTVSQSMTMSVQAGDLNSLQGYLASIGVEPTDIAEISEAVSSEKPTAGGEFGQRVNAWIGKMVGKAASGSWAIAVGTAADLTARAIAAYYGLQ